MAKNKASQQINGMAQLVGRNRPRTVSEALERGSALADRLQGRITRQKAMLDRTSDILKRAVDECMCGGVEKAIKDAGSLAEEKGGDSGSETASNQG